MKLPARTRPHPAQHQFAAVRPERRRQFAETRHKGAAVIIARSWGLGTITANGDFGVANKAGNIVTICPKAGADFGGILAGALPPDRPASRARPRCRSP